MSQQEGKDVIVQGRIVWVGGDLFAGRKKIDMNTKQIRRDKEGNEVQEYCFGLAVPKSELATDADYKGSIWYAMHAAANALYPSGHVPKDFAWKYDDGDGIDHRGQPFASREGYPGCLIFKLTTQMPPRFFKWENGANMQVSEGIKCGDYVNVQVRIKGHPARSIQEKAGLYLNPQTIQFVAPGKEIVNAPNADQVFGLAAPTVPAGYVPPPQPTMPAALPPPTQQAYVPPPAAPAPHYPVLPLNHQPPPGGLPMTPPPPPSGHAPAAAYPLPGVNPAYPAPAAPVGSPTMPGPTGYPPGGAPMAASHGSGMPPIPGR